MSDNSGTQRRSLLRNIGGITAGMGLIGKVGAFRSSEVSDFNPEEYSEVYGFLEAFAALEDDERRSVAQDLSSTQIQAITDAIRPIDSTVYRVRETSSGKVATELNTQPYDKKRHRGKFRAHDVSETNPSGRWGWNEREIERLRGTNSDVAGDPKSSPDDFTVVETADELESHEKSSKSTIEPHSSSWVNTTSDEIRVSVDGVTGKTFVWGCEASWQYRNVWMCNDGFDSTGYRVKGFQFDAREVESAILATWGGEHESSIAKRTESDGYQDHSDLPGCSSGKKYDDYFVGYRTDKFTYSLPTVGRIYDAYPYMELDRATWKLFGVESGRR